MDGRALIAQDVPSLGDADDHRTFRHTQNIAGRLGAGGASGLNVYVCNLDNELLTKPVKTGTPAKGNAPVARRERLGGLLNFYFRPAA